MLREHERAHASSDKRVVLVHAGRRCIFGHDDRSKEADNRVQLTRHLPTERNDGFIPTEQQETEYACVRTIIKFPSLILHE